MVLRAVFKLIIAISALHIACGHPDFAYQHQDYLPYNQDWMGNINNLQLLNKMSIPGTHDSGALHGGTAAQTQSVSIANQLNAGIRAFDIRCKVAEKNDYRSLYIYHGITYQKMSFLDVMRNFRTFLQNHPSEVLIVRIKKEKKDTADDDWIKCFREIFGEFDNYIWKAHSNPHLGAVRRKIIFLDNFSTEDSSTDMTNYGINYNHFKEYTQDNSKVAGVDNTYKKWEQIRDRLDAANSSTEEVFHINFLSASGGYAIYTFASGHIAAANGAARTWAASIVDTDYSTWSDWPRDNCWGELCTIYIEGNNILARDRIRKLQLKHVGIIFADFPGADLIKVIIDSNK